MSDVDESGDVWDLPPIPQERAATYRRAATRPPVSDQVAGLLHDLACQRALSESGDPRARGAALAVGFAALRLAVTPVRAEVDRHRRDEALQSAFLILARAGLGHVGELVAAALACETDPACLVRGVERPQ